MVRAKLQYYYTFKLVDDGAKTGQVVIEAHKWEEATGEHVTVYKAKPGIEWMGCSCPSYRPCKHKKCAEEAIASGKIAELWKWRWDEKVGWQQLDDIPPIEDIQL